MLRRNVLARPQECHMCSALARTLPDSMQHGWTLFVQQSVRLCTPITGAHLHPVQAAQHLVLLVFAAPCRHRLLLVPAGQHVGAAAGGGRRPQPLLPGPLQHGRVVGTVRCAMRGCCLLAACCIPAEARIIAAPAPAAADEHTQAAQSRPTCGLFLSDRCSSVALGSCKLWPGAARLACCAARCSPRAAGGGGGRTAAARGAAASAAAAAPSASRFIPAKLQVSLPGGRCRRSLSAEGRREPQEQMPWLPLAGRTGCRLAAIALGFDVQAAAGAGAMDVVACMPAVACLPALPSLAAASTDWGIQTPIADTHCWPITQSDTQQ